MGTSVSPAGHQRPCQGRKPGGTPRFGNSCGSSCWCLRKLQPRRFARKLARKPVMASANHNFSCVHGFVQLYLASLCSTKCIFLPFFTLPFLLCHFPVATTTDVGWFYLFPPFLCHLGGVQLISIFLFHLFSTGLGSKLRMRKALTHLLSLWPECS